MRERPQLADTTIEAALRMHFGVSIATLTFLPLGADSASAVYRVEAADGAAYLLKTRRGQGFSAASLVVPRHLHDLGVPHIVAPLLTFAKTQWIMVDNFALTLYPFIDGRIGGDAGLSERHWIEFGTTMRQIHRVQLPPDLMDIVPRESYVPSRRSVVDDLEEAISRQVPEDPVQRELAAFWNSRRDEIRTLLNRADALGRRLREASAPLVLCHADLHTRNLLLEGDDQFWIVDWDETVLAPKERDLMFVVGGIARELLETHHTELFFRGYGDTAIDPHTLAYYRYAWAVQDVGAYGEQSFLAPELSEESRRFALGRFMSLFAPGNIVPIALAGDSAA